MTTLNNIDIKNNLKNKRFDWWWKFL